jgi:hypothetical protein
MICDKCKSKADHPSNSKKHRCKTVGCGCQHNATTIPVEKFYDPLGVNLEWVRTRRTTGYSR